MRRRHFEAINPLCPVCRTGSGTEHALEIALSTREERDVIVEGVLHCTNAKCQREYPIIDGIPLIIPGIRAYLSDNTFQVCARMDLTETVESVLGDCCGPGSIFDVVRQHLSSYVWDHYAEFDPREPARDPRPGSILRVLEHGLALADEIPAGPIIDVGCSVGRTSFALAERSDALVLGVDLNYSMLRLASQILRSGTVRYPRRRVGLVYERREFPVDLQNSENVDFWACDATALPFAAETFATAVSLNTLDCVHSPAALLASMASVLQPGGQAVFCCPYDWSHAATPVEAWLGGHSQRSPAGGASDSTLRALLAARGDRAAEYETDANQVLQLVSEADDLTWHVRMHERSVMSYKVHLVVAKAGPSVANASGSNR